jgi:hypothetical protein
MVIDNKNVNLLIGHFIRPADSNIDSLYVLTILPPSKTDYKIDYRIVCYEYRIYSDNKYYGSISNYAINYNKKWIISGGIGPFKILKKELTKEMKEDIIEQIFSFKFKELLKILQ